MKPIFIVGAGGLGREVAWTIERINAVVPAWELLGFADDDPALQTGTVERYPLWGTVRQAAERHIEAAVVIAIGSNAIREKIFHELGAREYPAIIDPAALVAPSAKVSDGAFVGPYAVVSVNARVGRFALVNARAGVGHDCRLGDFAQLCPGASLSGNTTVGALAMVGTNASTVPGVKIGERAQIAAGLPVYRDVAPDTTLSPFGSFKNACL